MKFRTFSIVTLCALLSQACSTPEQTSRAVKGGVVGAGVGGLMGGWSGAAAGAAVTGLLGAATATGDPRYGSYNGATPARATSGNTKSRSSSSMGYRF